MKKLALNSLLAITTMAWLGQAAPTAADTKRDGSRRSHTEEVRVVTTAQRNRFSAGDRAVLRNHVRELGALPRASVAVSAGQTLGFDLLRSARTLPGHVISQLSPMDADITVLLIQDHVVRLRRSDHTVLDVMLPA